ncbi:efflux RND transporter periplasmic adaptor subunit [Methylocapsa polymorpha]|uniref:Efflux RND transporter periplasmic adaptor subunit n=1 Tax=Methylocapsa polymorpha TaxID=3080828 RepID=A0ABZ0HP51_9HYPH|nr:efflux RND transporter periplasmic adaptor subunit [Methylocapsa sp. RX1]
MATAGQNINDPGKSQPEIGERASPIDSPDPACGGTPPARAVARAPAIVVAFIVIAIVGLSLWYLVQPQPLLIQGEADATRIDIAARVDGRVGQRPVSRGDNVAAGQLLFQIENPELLAKLREAEAAMAVAAAELAHIEAGTREEVIAQRKATVDSALANLTLAQRTYDRIKELAASANAPLQRLDEVTNSLQVAQRSADQAKLAYQEAIAGYTPEERGVARANVAKARASIDTIRAQVDELVVKAPVSAQVYQIGAELGEYVSPGVPLLSLVDLSDVWLRFDLREDLVKGLKVGDRFQMRVPALGDRLITAAIRVIAAKGEYAGWRATRATGDFDLRTFEVRAYPVDPVPELRPGMSVYAEWRGDKR